MKKTNQCLLFVFCYDYKSINFTKSSSLMKMLKKSIGFGFIFIKAFKTDTPLKFNSGLYLDKRQTNPLNVESLIGYNFLTKINIFNLFSVLKRSQNPLSVDI